MSATLPTYTLQELESTLGVLFVGYVVAMILYGFTFFQTYLYFSRYPKDNILTKMMVGTLCLLDTATSGLMSQALYFYLVTLFPFTLGLVDATPSFCAENGFAVIVTYIVQLYYASRLRSLSKNNIPLVGSIVILGTAGFSLGISMTVNMFHNRAFADLAIARFKRIAALSQAMVLLTDVAIVAALLYYLQPKRNPLMKPLSGWFDKLVTYTITRGTISTVIQAVYFLTFVTMPTKAVWMPFHLVVSKLYINSVLTLLNSREIVRGEGVSEEQSLSTSSQRHQSGITSSNGRTPTTIRFGSADHKNPVISISVQRTVEHDDHLHIKEVDLSDDGVSYNQSKATLSGPPSDRYV